MPALSVEGCDARVKSYKHKDSHCRVTIKKEVSSYLQIPSLDI